MSNKKKRNFCDIHPICYEISKQKEILKRMVTDIFSKEKFAKTIKKDTLSNVVYNYSSNIIKKGKDIDVTLQENKAVNIAIASSKINGMIIYPGEVFSFWKTVGIANEKNGYKAGRVILNNVLTSGVGGGLCNLANTINLLILHSPLDITELHKHSDALAMEEKRVPFSSGTSVSYNYIDYRFKNNTQQPFQLFLWCENGKLCGELRSEKAVSYHYELIEEDHHFVKENDKYYRVSKIYRQVKSAKTNEIIKKELIWDNHSLVMFDYKLIPKELLRE